jgi:excisionase family DNA binding protein
MKFYTAEEVAEMLDVQITTVREWLRTRTLAGSKSPAGWRISQDDIDQFMERHRPAPADGELKQ